MATTYVIDAENAVVKTFFDGPIRSRDVVALCNALAKDPTFKPEFSELGTFETDADLQLRFLDFVDLSTLDPFSKSAKRAFVASRPAVFGMLRMFQLSRNESPNIQVFKSPDDAWNWLVASGASA